ncbi:MAG: hypothetical protein HZA54_00765 [Planctomycetes bacterium]|nr:hypothetical protein [Planctomycetota bacterium]
MAAVEFRLSATVLETDDGPAIEIAGTCDVPQNAVLTLLLRLGDQVVPDLSAGALVDAEHRFSGRLVAPPGRRFLRAAYTAVADLDPTAQDPGVAEYFQAHAQPRRAECQVRIGSPAEAHRDREDARKHVRQSVDAARAAYDLLQSFAALVGDPAQPFGDPPSLARAEELRKRIERIGTTNEDYAVRFAACHFPDAIVGRIPQLVSLLDLLRGAQVVRGYVVRGRPVPAGDSLPHYAGLEITMTERQVTEACNDLAESLDAKEAPTKRTGEEALFLYPEEHPAGTIPAVVPAAAAGVLRSNPGKLLRDDLVRLPNPGAFLRQIPPRQLAWVYYAGLQAETVADGHAPEETLVEVLVCEFMLPDWCAAAATRLAAPLQGKPDSAGAVFRRDRLLVVVAPSPHAAPAATASLVALYRARIDEK